MPFNPTAALVTPTIQISTIFHTAGSNSTANARPYDHYSSLKTANKNANNKNESDGTAIMITNLILHEQ